MSRFTPTTAQMRMVYITEGTHLPAAKAHGYAESIKEFDRWLRQVKAEAWEEGAEYAWGRTFEGFNGQYANGVTHDWEISFRAAMGDYYSNPYEEQE